MLDHRTGQYRDAVTWRYAVTHDPDLSDTARTVALHLFDQPQLPAQPDLPQLAGLGIDQHAADFAIDELMAPPCYVNLFATGHVLLSFGRWAVRDRARKLAQEHRTSIGQILRDAQLRSTSAA